MTKSFPECVLGIFQLVALFLAPWPHFAYSCLIWLQPHLKFNKLTTTNEVAPLDISIVKQLAMRHVTREFIAKCRATDRWR